MDPLIIVAGIPVAVALFGVIRQKRFFFLLGYFLYALLVVPNEWTTYQSNGDMAHLAYAFLWLVQAMPVSLEFAESSKTVVVFYHSILAFLPMVALFLMATNRIPVGTND